jgi:hypothetical protein
MATAATNDRCISASIAVALWSQALCLVISQLRRKVTPARAPAQDRLGSTQSHAIC